MYFRARAEIAAAKLALGTALYVAILLTAQSYPTAAGMMLTFPALNGFTLSLVARDKLADTARIMLLLPIVNCLLCAGYIVAFVHFARESDQSLAWQLLPGVAILWLIAAIALGVKRIFFFQAEDGIRDRNVTGVQTCALPI